MATSKESGFMAPELSREREASKLDIQEITIFIDGGEMVSEKRKSMYQLVCQDPVFNLDDKYFLSREEAFERAMEKSVHYIKKSMKLDRLEKYYLKTGMNEEQPIGLHEGMFLPTLEGQATEEQKEKWLTPSLEYKLIGTYAQTELGHGTYVRGLETTATFDVKTQEFVINTPTLTATKWWPGSLGHTATHAVVLARLITKGVDYGIHPFIVQLRSLKDHTPLPGITVGDIGPKYGYFGMDNGFLSMNNVRIPRDQMLMKYSQVRPDGTYVKPPTSKMAYGTMVWVRSGIVIYVSLGLAKAVTIATRYSVIRRQGQSDNNGLEIQVMDYQTQQMKLLPLIAAAYALIQTGQYMLRHYVKAQSEIVQGNLEHLPELHATSSGLKAFSTNVSTQGMELCRKACGGHGYSRASGIPDIYVDLAPSVTYEGENTVLYLQTARYLNKLYSSKQLSSQIPENVSYLGKDFVTRPRCSVRTFSQFMDPNIQLEVYRQRARRMVVQAAKTYQRALEQGLKQSDAWNQSGCDWVAAANAHCHYISLKAFRESIQFSNLSPVNLSMIESLCALFAVHGILNYAGEFMMGGYMTAEQISLARQQLYALLKEVRKEAVPLVDAFDFPDGILNSSLGRYDGDVYNHLYQWAQRAPRNKKPVHDVYNKYLKKFLHSKL